MKQEMLRKLDFGCCFCGKGGADHGLALTDMDGEFEQQWWCHAQCLRGEMVPQAADTYYEAGEDG